MQQLKKMKEIAEIRTNFPEADFWLVRKGTPKKVGKPVQEFHPDYIGLRFDSSVAISDYFFYVMKAYHLKGTFEMMALGSLLLVHITVNDVGELPAHPR